MLLPIESPLVWQIGIVLIAARYSHAHHSIFTGHHRRMVLVLLTSPAEDVLRFGQELGWFDRIAEGKISHTGRHG